MKYMYKREAAQFPWRYGVYVNGLLTELTFTKWGAERLIARMRRFEDDYTVVG